MRSEVVKTGKKLEIELNQDVQRAAVCVLCRVCGGELFDGQRYYALAAGPVCPACLSAYARAVFLPALRTAHARRTPP